MKLTTNLLIPILALSLLGCDLLAGEESICPGEDGSLYTGRTPSDLETDCRCTASLQEPLCFVPPSAWGHFGNLGEGPQPLKMYDQAKIWYGELWEDRGEIIVPVALGANQPGFIMALNVETGDRRVISNRWVDYATGDQIVGEGDVFARPTYSLRGPDDMLYVYAHGSAYDEEVSGQVQTNEIIRVDPDTGDRELVWQYSRDVDNGFGQCRRPDGGPSYQLALEGKGFDVTDAGTFLFATIGQRAIIEVSADGSTCRIVSSPDIPVGGGVGMGIAIEEVQQVEGVIYAMDNSAIYSIDAESGDRTRIMNVDLPGRLQYDPRLDLIHLTGIHAPYGTGIHALDFANKKMMTWSCSDFIGDTIDPDHWSENCLDGGNGDLFLVSNQGWALADGKTFISVNNSVGFLKIEMSTGNANHFSF